MSHLGGAINSSVETRYTNGDPNATLLLRRSLQVLNAVLKEYAAFKMLTGVKTMGKVCVSFRFIATWPIFFISLWRICDYPSKPTTRGYRPLCPP